jgi:hypothetical protein
MGLTSERLRWRIIETWESLGGNLSATARHLELPISVVKTWVNRYKATGGVAPALKTGRRRVLSDQASEIAHEMLLSESQDCGHTVALQLHSRGITKYPLNRKTVIRACRRVAEKKGRPIVAQRVKPRKQLTDGNMQKRLDFSEENLSRLWDDVMITDRKRFLFKYPGAKVNRVQWVEVGSHREAPKVNHPACVNVYGGLTMYGVTKLVEVAGTSHEVSKYKTKRGTRASNITQAEYKSVLNFLLLPEGQRIFKKHGISSWMLQQDNDKEHNVAKAVINTWNKQHSTSIGLLKDWPPNSPDLSPIENLWGWVEARVDARGCKNYEEWKRSVWEEWGNVTPQLAQKLMQSMGRRLASCISVGGKKTKY